MPIDNPLKARPHKKVEEWRPLSGWEAPTKIPTSALPVASSGSAAVRIPKAQAEQLSGRPGLPTSSNPTNAPSQAWKALKEARRPMARGELEETPGDCGRKWRVSPVQSNARKRKRKTTSTTQSSIRIADIEGKGQGVFAAKPFMAGTTILRERPFVMFQDPLTSLEVYTALTALSPDSRDIFWSFSGRGAHTPMDVDIAETNLIPFDGEEACGMFENICRINHSCSPNARWIWSSTDGKMAVRALCDIAIDEEITVSYLDPCLLIDPERKDLIKSLYHFECRCRTCTSPRTAQSDADRSRLKKAFERWENEPIDEWTSPDLSAAVNRSRTLQEMDRIEEIIKYQRLTVFLPQLLEYRFQLHAAWGEYELAKGVGRQWEAEEKMIGERKGVNPEEVSRIRKDPKRWGQWGQLKKLYPSKVKPIAIGTQYGRKAAG